jgi:hypothetical protein
MEKHVNEKIYNYVDTMKHELLKMVSEYDIEQKIKEKELMNYHSNSNSNISSSSSSSSNLNSNIHLLHNSNTSINIHQIMNYIKEYPMLEMERTDFLKRKRVRNVVPFYDRCIAKRANGEQCTRRRKTDEELCGTHIKGIPHGKMSGTDEENNEQKIMLMTQDIKGIMYYIDEHENIYDTGDIINGIKNPRIIAKYDKDDTGDYNIRTC